jgi:hypothetical protein
MVYKNFGRAIVTVVKQRAMGGNVVVLQVAAVPILYVVRYFTTRSVLDVQPVSRAGYSSVHPRHLERCSRYH